MKFLLLCLGLAAGLWPAGAPAAPAAPAAAAPPAPPPPPASFALIGDVPYGSAEEQRFDRVIDAINAAHAAGSVQWAVHTGDIKRGREPCSEALYGRRLAQLQRLAPPTAFTPGDNDWTDCHHVAAGRHHPIERLESLRRTFYPWPGRSLGREPAPVVIQPAMDARFPAFVEHQLWALAGVTMATLHVVGSSNGLEPWAGLAERPDSLARPRQDRLGEFVVRETAVLAWMDTVFDHARREGSAGVVLVMQANPRFDLQPWHAQRQGFNRILQALARHALRFGRPVLLAHGDTHTFRDDQPLARAQPAGGLPMVPNLRRVENFGSPLVHWVQVRIDASRPEVFEITPRLVPANLWPLWPAF